MWWQLKYSLNFMMNLFVPEQLRALAFMAGEDMERGLNFIRGCFDRKASLAEKRNEFS